MGMKNINRFIKMIFYNNQWNYLAMAVVAAATIFVNIMKFIDNMVALGIYIFLMLYYMANRSMTKVRNKDLYYFNINYSLLYKKRVWINQKVKRGRDLNICPQTAFKEELKRISEKLPEGTICYCYTQSYVVKQICECFTQVEKTPIYKKEINHLVKQIKNLKCNLCTENCILKNNGKKSRKKQFYAVKFVVE